MPDEKVAVRFPITVTVEPEVGDELPFDLELVLTGDETRPVLRCERLVCERRDDGTFITASSLRRIPWREITEQAVNKASYPYDPEKGTVAGIDFMIPSVSAGAESAVRAPRKRGRHSTIPDEKLPEVADVYRAAQREGDRGTNIAIAEHFNVHRSTAARAVRRAKNAELLDEEG